MGDHEGNVFHGNYQGCRSSKNVVRYCSKEEDFVANFDVGQVASARNNRRKIGTALLSGDKTLQEVVRENPELIFGYKRLKLDLLELREDLYPAGARIVECRWYHGPTRTGKTYRAVQELGGKPDGVSPGIYLKDAATKWWCGYSGEALVLIDELPVEAAYWISNYLKRWADKLPTPLEVKGGRATARWTKLYVTC